jgi:hypothetical protein
MEERAARRNIAEMARRRLQARLHELEFAYRAASPRHNELLLAHADMPVRHDSPIVAAARRQLRACRYSQPLRRADHHAAVAALLHAYIRDADDTINNNS